MGLSAIELVDHAGPDVEALDGFVSRLKSAPVEHIPEPAMLRIKKWIRPSSSDIKQVLSITGLSEEAKLVLREVLFLTKQLEEQ